MDEEKKKFKCSECGREFDSPGALGGHMQVHRRPEPPPDFSGTGEPGEAEQIRELLRQGYTYEQLTKQFGFKSSTVRQEMAKFVPPAGEKGGDKGDKSDKSLAKREAFPTKLGLKDMVPPEALVSELSLPDGDTMSAWVKGVVSGIQLLLLGARYSQLLAGAQAEITETQLKILREAKSAETEIADRAAKEAALKVADYFERTQPWKQVPAATGPFERMMNPVADAIGKQLEQVVGRMFGLGGQGQGAPQPPPGWTYENKKEGGNDLSGDKPGATSAGPAGGPAH